MQSFYGDTEDSKEDIPGHKKSKFKSLKTRLLGRSKQGSEEGKAPLSQSASDITAGEGLGSEEDLACSQGMMGSRALSHDSIFLADEVQTDAEPGRVLSQENVHSKIKALQIKLQQQKMHLGPPPLVLPIRRPEDPESRPEDDGLSHSPPENSGGDFITQAALSKTIYQPFSCPLSPKPAPTKSVPQTTFQPLPRSVPSNSSVVESPLDFSSPAQFTRCLDTSAARHRMSIKPRKQRASTKKKITATDSSSLLNALNNIDHPEPMREEEEQLSTQEEVTRETEQGGPIIPITFQPLPPKSSEMAPTTPKTASTSTDQNLPQQDQTVPGRVPSVPPQAIRVKPHRPLDVMSSERPHSCFIPSELKDKREEGSEIQVMSHDKRTTPNKAGMTAVSSDQPSTTFGSVVASRSSSVQQEVQGETESMRGIKRPAPGSGSFHFSITAAKNRDVERPRSGSFAEVLEQTEARQRAEDKPFSSTREKADSQPRGGSFTVGRLRQEGAVHKSLVLPWDKRDDLKKVELVTPAKIVTTDADAAKEQEAESSQEPVEDAVEAQEVEEDEGKTAFGIKLRSTSQSMRLRFDASSKHSLKPAVYEEPCDKQKRQETSDSASYVCQKLPTSISCTTSTSGNLLLIAPSGFSHPIKQNPPTTCDPHIMPTEVQTTSSNPKEVETTFAAPQEPQPVRQPAPPEVSWMSLAMEKTRSLQQLFTSRFPRDFTSVQSAARPQAQVQTATQIETLTGAQIQTQTIIIQENTTSLEAANQPSADAVKAETVQIRSLAQTVKPTLMVVQPKTSMAFPVQSNTSREPQASKQTNEPQSHPSTTQSASQPVPVQANPATSQSPSAQTSSQLAQGSVTQSLAQSYLSSGQQQPPWSNRGLQLKSATPAPTSDSTTSSATALPPVSASGGEEREASMQEKESTSLSGRRAVWSGSVSERAAFLEKRAEWANPPGTKGVEVKKVHIEAQTSDESPAKTIALSKDTNPEGGLGGKPAESSPTKVPDRPCEDRWLRKNVSTSSSPSSSPTMPSALASISDSGQPSWMELAKRKSMAWSDKSMD
ncbi:uncharacterized protein cracdla isoform X2 [Chaetodon auriga]|uniref:uncharacterized protein cracdla isoform X2 n=1 Tax=Chaetodon auriga TaxID=39042 RepID=UPI0040329FB0